MMSTKNKPFNYLNSLSPEMRVDYYEKMVRFFSGICAKYPCPKNSAQLTRFNRLLEQEIKKQ